MKHLLQALNAFAARLGRLTFMPAKNTTRGEFVKMLVAAYAKNEVEYLISIGVVNGYLDNTLKPKNLIAREEAAKIIYECILISDAFGAK